MIDKIVAFFAEYLKGRPITDVLLIVLIGQAIWVESVRRGATDHAHDVMRSYLRDVRDEADKNADRLVSVLTDIKHDQKKAVEAAKTTAEATSAIAEKTADPK